MPLVFREVVCHGPSMAMWLDGKPGYALVEFRLRLQKHEDEKEKEEWGPGLTIFLKQTRLLGSHARGSVVSDPGISPIGRDAPAIRVQMESSKVECRNGQVLLEVDSLSLGVRVASITTTIHKPLITKRDHVGAIQALNVRASRRRPFVDHIRAASWAAHFVRQLPGEDRRRGLIPIHNRLDVFLELCLHFGIGVPVRLGGDTIVGVVRRHSSVVVPVVHEWDDELDTVSLSALYYVIEALETVRAGVDYGILPGDEGLIPDFRRGGLDVVEAPDAQDLDARGLQVRHDKVDICVVGEEGDPVGVRSCPVLGRAVNVE